MVDATYTVERAIPEGCAHLTPPEGSPVPCLSELAELCSVKGIRPYVCVVRESAHIAAVVPLERVRARAHGVVLTVLRPIAGGPHDYTTFYTDVSREMPDVGHMFRQAAREARVDAVLASGLLLPTPPPQGLLPWLSSETRHVFEAGKAAKSWNEITSKRSVRYAMNVIRKRGDFAVETKHGSVEAKDVRFVAQAHIERWAFAGHGSHFEQEGAVAEFASYPANKILTTVKSGDDWVALHYGTRYGSTLLLHTPVVNVKYMDFSPLQILLSVIASWCAENGMDVLDFGLGEDDYKNRFANSERTAWHLFIPISWRAGLAGTVRRVVDPSIMREKWAAYEPRLKQAAYRPLVLTDRVLLYEYVNGDGGSEGDARFVVVDDQVALADLFRGVGGVLHVSQYERIRQGDRFIALVDEGRLLSSGWVAERETFHMTEIDVHYRLDEALMLYDFHTPEAERNKGYYTALLRAACARFSDRRLLIFARASNHASNRGITKAGFAAKGTLTHWRPSCR